MTVFEKAFAVVVGEEGGFDATPADPGNWTGGAVGQGSLGGTKFGISAAAYPTLDIRALALADARAIYRRDYWDRVQGDALPPPLALVVFDAAVNNGVAQAARWLQTPVDVAARPAAGARDGGGAGLCAEMLAQRLNFMASLPTWRVFGLGWAPRLCALPYRSLAMEST